MLLTPAIVPLATTMLAAGGYRDNVQAANRPLGDVLGDLDKLEDDEATIYVEDGPVNESTESLVLADGEEPPAGFKYLLEVYLAKDVIDVWSKWRGGKRPSRAERSVAVAHYASHDAFLPAEPAR